MWVLRSYLLLEERLVLVLLLELLLRRRLRKDGAPGELGRLDQGEACKTKHTPGLRLVAFTVGR